MNTKEILQKQNARNTLSKKNKNKLIKEKLRKLTKYHHH